MAGRRHKPKCTAAGRGHRTPSQAAAAGPLVARVQLRRLSLVSDLAVSLIHYKESLSDTVLSV